MLAILADAEKTSTAWGKQNLLGQKHKFGTVSVWNWATLRIKVISY